MFCFEEFASEFFVGHNFFPTIFWAFSHSLYVFDFFILIVCVPIFENFKILFSGMSEATVLRVPVLDFLKMQLCVISKALEVWSSQNFGLS